MCSKVFKCQNLSYTVLVDFLFEYLSTESHSAGWATAAWIDRFSTRLKYNRSFACYQPTDSEANKVQIRNGSHACRLWKKVWLNWNKSLLQAPHEQAVQSECINLLKEEYEECTMGIALFQKQLQLPLRRSPTGRCHQSEAFCCCFITSNESGRKGDRYQSMANTYSTFDLPIISFLYQNQ